MAPVPDPARAPVLCLFPTGGGAGAGAAAHAVGLSMMAGSISIALVEEWPCLFVVDGGWWWLVACGPAVTALFSHPMHPPSRRRVEPRSGDSTGLAMRSIDSVYSALIDLQASAQSIVKHTYN